MNDEYCEKDKVFYSSKELRTEGFSNEFLESSLTAPQTRDYVKLSSICAVRKYTRESDVRVLDERMKETAASVLTIRLV